MVSCLHTFNPHAMINVSGENLSRDSLSNMESGHPCQAPHMRVKGLDWGCWLDDGFVL